MRVITTACSSFPVTKISARLVPLQAWGPSPAEGQKPHMPRYFSVIDLQSSGKFADASWGTSAGVVLLARGDRAGVVRSNQCGATSKCIDSYTTRVLAASGDDWNILGQELTMWNSSVAAGLDISRNLGATLVRTRPGGNPTLYAVGGQFAPPGSEGSVKFHASRKDGICEPHDCSRTANLRVPAHPSCSPLQTCCVHEASLKCSRGSGFRSHPERVGDTKRCTRKSKIWLCPDFWTVCTKTAWNADRAITEPANLMDACQSFTSGGVTSSMRGPICRRRVKAASCK